MLILVAVTIAIVIEGGLFTEARRAATGTEAAIQEETNIASGVYGGKTIDEWVTGATGEEIIEKPDWIVWEDTDGSGDISVKDVVTCKDIQYLVFSKTGDTVDLISAEGLGKRNSASYANCRQMASFWLAGV